jgi:hypothetical protein
MQPFINQAENIRQHVSDLRYRLRAINDQLFGAQPEATQPTPSATIEPVRPLCAQLETEFDKLDGEVHGLRSQIDRLETTLGLGNSSKEGASRAY